DSRSAPNVEPPVQIECGAIIVAIKKKGVIVNLEVSLTIVAGVGAVASEASIIEQIVSEDRSAVVIVVYGVQEGMEIGIFNRKRVCARCVQRAPERRCSPRIGRCVHVLNGKGCH